MRYAHVSIFSFVVTKVLLNYKMIFNY